MALSFFDLSPKAMRVHIEIKVRLLKTVFSLRESPFGGGCRMDANHRVDTALEQVRPLSESFSVHTGI